MNILLRSSQRAASALLVLLVMVTSAQAAHHTLAERIATDSRSAADRDRDAGRKPADVLEFLGVDAGMRVVDIMAAGGWYTEVLAHAVGEDGAVAAQNPDFILKFRDGANDKALSARLADGRLPNVSRLDKDFAELSGADGQFDVALSALNFHDIYNSSGSDAAVGMLVAIKAILKPGGVFGIIDHAGNAGADNESLHRIDSDKVLETAKAAGFEVVGESTLLASSADDRSGGVFGENIRGKTDRFIVKLRKPAM